VLGSRVLAHQIWLDPMPINLHLLYITWEESLFINNMQDSIMSTKESKEDKFISNIKDSNLRTTSYLNSLLTLSHHLDIIFIHNQMEVHLQYLQSPLIIFLQCLINNLSEHQFLQSDRFLILCVPLHFCQV